MLTLTIKRSWRSFIALFNARNKEFLRDRGALSWSIILPVLIVVACAFAFSNSDDSVLTIAIVQDTTGSAQTINDADKLSRFVSAGYFEKLELTELSRALDQLGYQRIDLVLDTAAQNYWINQQSNASLLAENLLLGQSGLDYDKQVISGKQLRYIDWVLPGILGMNMMFGSLFGAGYVIVRYRNNGVLKRYQATPVTAFEFLASQVVSRVFIMLAATIIIFTGCMYFLDFVVLGSYSLLLFIAILGALALVSLGLLLSCRTASEELAGGMLNMATWPMMLLSEVWFSLDDASEFMKTISNCLPLTHIVKAARAVMLDGASFSAIAHHMIILLLMTLVFIAVASKLFRWHKSA